MKVPRVFEVDKEEQAIMFTIILLKPFYGSGLDRIFRTVGAYFGFTTLRNQ